MNESPNSIFIIDDHNLVIDGIRLIIQSDSRLEFVGYASSYNDAMTKLRALSKFPDVLICDYRLPDGTGDELASRLKEMNYNFKYIFLSMIMEGRIIRNCWRNGCDAFLGKNVHAKELLSAIQTVLKGKRYISREQSLLLKEDTGQRIEDVLSKREKEVLECILEGLPSKEIADKLSISKRTVDNHRQNILNKTGSRNTAGLVSNFRK